MIELHKLYGLLIAYIVYVFEEGYRNMEKLYQFLCEFANNTHPTTFYLTNRYGAKALSEAIEEDLIYVYGKNECNDTVYAITLKGKARRDG